MSNRYAKKLELLNEILQTLSEKSSLKIPVIVEGKKDVTALRKLGINAVVVCIRTNCGHGFWIIVEVAAAQ